MEAAVARQRLGAPSPPRLVVSFDPPQASAVSFGNGCAGGGASPLALAPVGLPTIGNAGFAMRVTGGPSAPVGVVGFSVLALPAPIPLPGGCEFWLDPASFLTGFPLDAAGRVGLPIPNDPSLLGVSFPAQGVVPAAGTGLPATSNALRLTLGV